MILLLSQGLKKVKKRTNIFYLTLYDITTIQGLEKSEEEDKHLLFNVI
jgi:hypothetical protein